MPNIKDQLAVHEIMILVYLSELRCMIIPDNYEAHQRQNEKYNIIIQHTRSLWTKTNVHTSKMSELTANQRCQNLLPIKDRTYSQSKMSELTANQRCQNLLPIKDRTYSQSKTELTANQRQNLQPIKDRTYSQLKIVWSYTYSLSKMLYLTANQKR